jgi:hypothetical protein
MATKEKPSFATETTMSLSKIPFNFKQLHKKRLTVTGKPFQNIFNRDKIITAYPTIGFYNDGRDVFVRNSFL